MNSRFRSLTFPRLLSLGAALAFSLATPAVMRAEAGRMAPAWKLKDVNGKEVALADFKGKVVVLDFWASWCPPCRAEIPGYIGLQEKYAKDGLVIIGVSYHDQTAAVKEFMSAHQMNYPVVIGTDEVVEAYGNFEGIPTTFIINRAGRIVHQKTGRMETAEYEKLLRSFLK